jgi:guanylate kinase
VWVTPEQFGKHAERGGFYEWAEYLGNLYGTPVPHAPPDTDVLLEIDLQGAEQVVAKRPDAVVVLLVPPSVEVQRERLVARGDSEEHVRQRLEKGVEEVRLGRKLARYEVVNADVGRAVEELAGIVAATRRERHQP